MSAAIFISCLFALMFMIMQGYTARNILHRLAGMPCEDSYAFDSEQGIGVVADGVTRDSMQWLPDERSLWGKLKFATCYERESKAAMASAVCVDTIGDYLRESPERHQGALWFAFQKANLLIHELNCSLGLTSDSVDYLENNYAGCVAAAALVNSGKLHWAYLADCGVAIVDRTGDLVERTKDEGPSVHDEERWQYPELQGRVWEDPFARAFIRKMFVNTPQQPFSYGTLTGEPTAMSYVRTGTRELREREQVLIYSDGA